MQDEHSQLDEIARSLEILVAIEIQKYRAMKSDSSDLLPLEIMLSDAGISGRKISQIMGKSPQAVSQAIQRYKAKNSSP